jgi:hypothetical protein
MATRREDLAEALDALEADAGLNDAPAEVIPDTSVDASIAENIIAAPESAEDAAARARDELGRFSEKKPAAPNPEAVAGSETVVERPEPPKSWKAEKRAVWDKLDPETAAYISQREQEMSRGVEQDRERLAPAVQFYQAVQPFVDEIRQMGRDPNADMRDLLYTRQLLSHGDEATKFQTIVNVAHACGIPLGQMLQQSAAVPPHMQQHLDPNVMAAQQRARDLEHQMTQRQQFDQQQIQAAAQQEVENFRTSHPHVEELGPEMQRLLQAGLATDLDSAYSKALRLNDKLFTQSQAQQRETAEKERRTAADKAAKAAKANAVSTRTATPGSVTAATGGAAKGRRAALEEAFDNATASRI